MKDRPVMEFLTVEDLRDHLNNYGDRAGVIAIKGRIVFFDTDEGGEEVGHIDTPDGSKD